MIIFVLVNENMGYSNWHTNNHAGDALAVKFIWGGIFPHLKNAIYAIVLLALQQAPY